MDGLYLSFVIATKETKSPGRKDIQPLPAVQLCGTAVLLWLRLLIFIVRLQYRHCLDLPAVDTFNFMTVFINSHSLSFFCHCHKRNKKSRQEGYTAPSCHAALWYYCATVVCTIELYCTPSVQAVFINNWQWHIFILTELSNSNNLHFHNLHSTK